jgi:hypothetical protein
VPKPLPVFVLFNLMVDLDFSDHTLTPGQRYLNPARINQFSLITMMPEIIGARGKAEEKPRCLRSRLTP